MTAALDAFEGIGIELEYMIVDAASLDVRPLADRLLQQDGRCVNEIARGALGWSNELALHVIEVKNRDPHTTLDALAPAFATEVAEIERRLESHGARLMPGAMHPWMDPLREMRLWPHGDDSIYRAYDRIFDCRGHGWANLQSMHINLPFADDAQFARLHATVRLVLPLLPALAASSPVADGRIGGWDDTRMRVYCDNAHGFPSIAGLVVPESVDSRAAYESRILQPMYAAIAQHDPQGVLQHEWLNSRGAIARFDRHAIEIRVIDTQECPHADFAIAAATVAVVRMLYDVHDPTQQDIGTEALGAILQRCMREAERARIDDAHYLRLLGIETAACSAGEAWRALLARSAGHEGAATGLARWRPALDTILERGPLARRILHALGPAPDRARLQAVYRRLCDCLRSNSLFA